MPQPVSIGNIHLLPTSGDRPGSQRTNTPSVESSPMSGDRPVDEMFAGAKVLVFSPMRGSSEGIDFRNGQTCLFPTSGDHPEKLRTKLRTLGLLPTRGDCPTTISSRLTSRRCSSLMRWGRPRDAANSQDPDMSFPQIWGSSSCSVQTVSEFDVFPHMRGSSFRGSPLPHAMTVFSLMRGSSGGDSSG